MPSELRRCQPAFHADPRCPLAAAGHPAAEEDHATSSAYHGLTARLQVNRTNGSTVAAGDRLACFAASSEDASGHAGAGPGALSGAHAERYRHFLDAVTRGRPAAVTVADATGPLAVVRGVYESARPGRPVPV